MNKIRNLFSLLSLVLCPLLLAQPSSSNTYALRSPDGQLRLDLAHDTTSGLRYSLTADERALIADAPFGWASEDGQPLIGEWTGLALRSVDAMWDPVWGKRTQVPERFNEAVIDLGSFQVVARVYDDGLALRTLGASGPGFVDRTRFDFTGDFVAWSYRPEQQNRGPERISSIEGVRLPVVTIKAYDDAYLAIHEADLASGEPLRLRSSAGEVSLRVASSPNSAWLVIFFGRSPGAMVDSHLLELLNPAPPEGADFSWVKPVWRCGIGARTERRWMDSATRCRFPPGFAWSILRLKMACPISSSMPTGMGRSTPPSPIRWRGAK
jgi:alpha-glucosidase